MNKLEAILKEIEILIREISNLDIIQEENKNLSKLIPHYESWYTRSLSVVKRILPDRVEDFRNAYKLDKRKDITYATYTISDFLMGLVVRYGGSPTFNTEQAYQSKLMRQVSILRAAQDVAPNVLHDIQTVLRAELFDNDIDAAKGLAKAKHLRSAGVVCGVVLEAHLKSVADNHKLAIKKKNPTIAELNDALKDGGVYDVPMWRFVQRLGDIRNYCGHSKEREPTKDEVNDLIIGTEKVIKEVF